MPSEIKVIEQHLRETANQKLGFAPPIFAVSARKAFLARTSGVDKERLWKESEFAALEAAHQPDGRPIETRSPQADDHVPDSDCDACRQRRAGA